MSTWTPKLAAENKQSMEAVPEGMIDVWVRAYIKSCTSPQSVEIFGEAGTIDRVRSVIQSADEIEAERRAAAA